MPLDQSGQAKHHHVDPRKQTPGGRHQIGTPAGFKSESVAAFLLECVAGFVGIRILALIGRINVLIAENAQLKERVAGLEAKLGQPPKTPDNSGD